MDEKESSTFKTPLKHWFSWMGYKLHNHTGVRFSGRGEYLNVYQNPRRSPRPHAHAAPSVAALALSITLVSVSRKSSTRAEQKSFAIESSSLGAPRNTPCRGFPAYPASRAHAHNPIGKSAGIIQSISPRLSIPILNLC